MVVHYYSLQKVAKVKVILVSGHIKPTTLGPDLPVRLSLSAHGRVRPALPSQKNGQDIDSHTFRMKSSCFFLWENSVVLCCFV